MEPHVVPILQAESYCSTCVNTMVREREAGLVVRERHGAGSIARPKRSRRAGAIVGGAHTLKEAQHMIAERMAARA